MIRKHFGRGGTADAQESDGGYTFNSAHCSFPQAGGTKKNIDYWILLPVRQKMLNGNLGAGCGTYVIAWRKGEQRWSSRLDCCGIIVQSGNIIVTQYPTDVLWRPAQCLVNIIMFILPEQVRGPGRRLIEDYATQGRQFGFDRTG